MPPRARLCLRAGTLIVYLQSLPGCPDLEAAVQELSPAGPLVWLDSARQHPVTGRWSMVGWDPWLSLRACADRLELRTSGATHRWRAHPLTALGDILTRYRIPTPSPLGAANRAVGLMGYLSYDLNRWIERLPAPQAGGAGYADLLWYGMRLVMLVDHLERRTWLVSVVDPHMPGALARREARERLEEVAARFGPMGSHAPERPPRRAGGLIRSSSLEPTTTQTEFHRLVERALAHIRCGDIFQANVAQRFTAAYEGATVPLYQALRRINPSPFACYAALDGLTVVSCSPERLVRVQEGRIETRPIAGTRPRGATPVDDALNSLELLLSEKERAEHLMLVDLARNDLGRVCATGSVAVNELMTLEDYSHVIHIVSEVAGRLRQGIDAVKVIRAVFPGGTITGCPKVRCMQILRELEPVARGLYTGSLGYLAFDGAMDLNIAIRTLVVHGGRLSFHVGAGIVADSDPEREYRETLAKAEALISALREMHDHPAAVHADPG